MSAPLSPAPDDVLHELLLAVEAQLAAARTADAGALVSSSEERRRLQEAVDIDAIRTASAETRAEAARVALRIRALDARIRTCGEIVSGAIAALDPVQAPQTYTRRAGLRGVR